ncbi:MAG: ABC transporter permease [Betaproteobacteria bacterium]
MTPDASLQIVSGALIFATNFALVVGLAAVGAALTERAGVLNLGHEGIMLFGAAAGFVAAHGAGNPWMGLAGGVAAGLALGTVKGLWSVLFKTEQVINGLLLVPIGFGLGNVLYKYKFAQALDPPRVPPVPPLGIPFLQDIPVLGPALFNRSALVYAALALIALTAWFLARTRAGMMMRAAGESPETLDFNGVRVDAYRFAATVIGAGLTGFAGALLAVDQLHLFHPLMTAGRGWIAIAIVIVGGWRPWVCVLAALLFGITDMIQFQVQIQASPVPYEVLLSLPYLATVAVLAWWRSSVRRPAALGEPYRRY